MNPLAMLGGMPQGGSPMGYPPQGQSPMMPGQMQQQPGGQDIGTLLQQLQDPMALASQGGTQAPMSPQLQALLMMLTKSGQTQVPPQGQSPILALLQQLTQGAGVGADRPQPGQGMPQGAAGMPGSGMGGSPMGGGMGMPGMPGM